jgi:ribosomal protein S21
MMGVKICVRDGEPIGKALRRFKKQLMLDGYWIAFYKHCQYLKPSDCRRYKRHRASKNRRRYSYYGQLQARRGITVPWQDDWDWSDEEIE